MTVDLLCGDLHTHGRIWRARDQSLHVYDESARLWQKPAGLSWQSSNCSIHTNKNTKFFDTYVKRFKSALSHLPAWNFRFEMRSSCLRLHADRGQWLQLLPWWRMSWSLSSDALGTQIGSLATYAKLPPFAEWLNYLRLLDAAKPSQRLTTPQRIYFKGTGLVFALEDSLSHAAQKLSQHGTWLSQYPITPSFEGDAPAWWDALVPSTMLFKPRQSQSLARGSAWFAIAYLRESQRLIVSDCMHQPHKFAQIDLGQPLHRFVKHLSFAAPKPHMTGVYLKGAQWVLPDSVLAWPGVNND